MSRPPSGCCGECPGDIRQLFSNVEQSAAVGRNDGQQVWEVEATVDKDKSQAVGSCSQGPIADTNLVPWPFFQSMLFVEVPPYRDHSICHAAKVTFYVINGKRKRSQPQHFTYTPLAVPSIKTEPVDEYESGQVGYAMPQILGIPPQPYYSSPRGLIHSDGGLVPCQQGRTNLTTPDSRFQQQSPAIVYPRGAKTLSGSPVLYQQPPRGGAPDPHRSVLVHAGSPVQPPASGAQSHTTSPGQHPSIIQFSPTNHLLRGAPPPPVQAQHVMYCESYAPEASVRSPAPPPAAHPQHYSTVIQQQPYVQKMAKNRASPGEMDPQGCPAPEEPRRVTIKQENLDQAYLDDGSRFSQAQNTTLGHQGCCHQCFPSLETDPGEPNNDGLLYSVSGYEEGPGPWAAADKESFTMGRKQSRGCGTSGNVTCSTF
ncbi:nuclear factor of activated T-cells, cytoplasmic 2-like [Scleropages formosus]|uniref:Nuclear factor of activated T-cells, cytoplasmic 2-like n=1 Tax=Scleropages formosus TaxID=113540 RepID=A0A0P7XM51_SCLFO|nr:nuclear factor of activated T-cells, cytoplasmic 2-like [Scleropages formosus]